MKPDYWAQTAEPMTPEERQAWIRARAKDARDQGCEIVRASIDPASIDPAHSPIPTLVEGWLDPRADQNVPPFWAMTAVDLSEQ